LRKRIKEPPSGAVPLFIAFREILEAPGITYRVEIFDFRQRQVIQDFRELL
jgi:hypothetical protein